MKYADIRFVKRMTKGGMTYGWYVAHKSYNVSDGREYINYENGKTVCKEYPAEWLPKRIQKYIADHDETEWSRTDDEYIVYIIK